MSLKKAEHKLFKTIRNTMKFTGDAVGLAALKLGHEAFAYKTITTMRKKGAALEEDFDDFLEDNIQKVKISVTEADLQDFKDKVKDGMTSIKEGKNIFFVSKEKGIITDNKGNVIEIADCDSKRYRVLDTSGKEIGYLKDFV